jgi:stage IV sporulation protein FB
VAPVAAEVLGVFTIPQASAYDLNFRLFRVPIRVSPFFWLIIALLGFGWLDLGFVPWLIWIACAFVSLVLHEMGHVLMGRWFGTAGQIVLHGFYGLSINAANLPLWWQRLLVHLAGPGIQLVLWGILFALIKTGVIGSPPRLVSLTLVMLRLINLYWPLINLLPIFPLDGGQVLRELLERFNPLNGLRRTLQISLGVSLGLMGLMLVGMAEPSLRLLPFNSVFLLIFFGLFAFNNYTLLQQVPARRSLFDYDDRLPWQR